MLLLLVFFHKSNPKLIAYHWLQSLCEKWPDFIILIKVNSVKRSYIFSSFDYLCWFFITFLNTDIIICVNFIQGRLLRFKIIKVTYNWFRKYVFVKNINTVHFTDYVLIWFLCLFIWWWWIRKHFRNRFKVKYFNTFSANKNIEIKTFDINTRKIHVLVCLLST